MTWFPIVEEILREAKTDQLIIYQIKYIFEAFSSNKQSIIKHLLF